MSVSEYLPVVRGSECLDYISRPIGFLNHDNFQPDAFYNNVNLRQYYCNPWWKWDSAWSCMSSGEELIYNNLQKWHHDPTKRVVGLIQGASDDGGLQVKILGNETIGAYTHGYETPEIGDVDMLQIQLDMNGYFHYELDSLGLTRKLDTLKTSLAEYPMKAPVLGFGYSGTLKSPLHDYTYDEANNFQPNSNPSRYWWGGGLSVGQLGSFWWKGQDIAPAQWLNVTTDPDTTVEFGHIYTVEPTAYPGFWFPKWLIDYPTSLISGNLYNAINDFAYYGVTQLPGDYPASSIEFLVLPFSGTTDVTKVNLTSIPFNIILTTDYSNAMRYLNDGTLPFDAKLYPLDWDYLPSYDIPNPTPDPDDPEPDDTPDDTIVDPTPDDVVDVDPDVDPTTTVQNLCNYNLYWLQADQWQGFINWFWHDISAWSGFDDLINSIQGLYNDLGSAVIMCRYMPVKAQWIGGLGDDENIKLGMIEKTGNVNTISKRAVPIRRDLGEITINQIVSNNFLDFSPYSQLSLYLPLHGFVDLDMNIFQGHKNDYKKLIIQGIYDLLSGTLQYLIYVKPNGKDKALVNSFVVKIAQDIPLTLQTKNDRDSMIFGNVASTVGGLLGAGASIATGNPIGIAMGSMNAVNTLASAGSKSAPMSVKGTTGEMGGLYAPERPMIILRRAAVQPSDSYEDSDKRLDTWKSRVGRLSGYGQPMGSINGYVQLAQPRIKFTHNIPLQSEIDELYQILQQGFVCSTKS